MKRLAVLVVVPLIALLAACGGSDERKPAASAPSTRAPDAATTSGASFSFVGFADHAAPNNSAPPDVTAAGGTIKSCNPASLYAWVNFSGLQPPKTFVGTWTLDGATLNQQTVNQTADKALTFWQVQNTPKTLSPGAYAFQLNVDNATVSKGQFTLTC